MWLRSGVEKEKDKEGFAEDVMSATFWSMKRSLAGGKGRSTNPGRDSRHLPGDLYPSDGCLLLEQVLKHCCLWVGSNVIIASCTWYVVGSHIPSGRGESIIVQEGLLSSLWPCKQNRSEEHWCEETCSLQDDGKAWIWNPLLSRKPRAKLGV